MNPEDEGTEVPSKGKKEIHMKSTGMVRKVDELGRIVLPSEIRQSMDIQERDSMEIFVEGNRIVLQKYHPGCVFCKNVDEITEFEGKRICAECLAKLKALS